MRKTDSKADGSLFRPSPCRLAGSGPQKLPVLLAEFAALRQNHGSPPATVRQAVINMRFFLAGIMQGSRADTALHQQDYRTHLAGLIATHLPDADVYDPLAGHPESVAYSEDDGRRVFYGHNRLCREVDVVIAFLPEASMGTAIEMWEAHEHGRAAVLTISPLVHNWAVRFCSHAIYPDLDAFENALRDGRVLETVERVITSRQARSP